MVALALGVVFFAVARHGPAQAPAAMPEPLTFDQSRSVYNRMLKPAEPADGVDWEARVDALLHEQPGDIIVTAVGDMILTRVELIPFSIDDEGPLYGVPRLASAARGRETIELLRRLSEPYGTRIVDKGRFAELELQP
jgi:hypothetical protein